MRVLARPADGEADRECRIDPYRGEAASPTRRPKRRPRRSITIFEMNLQPPLERLASDRERILAALGERLTARTVGKLDQSLASLLHDSRDVFQVSASMTRRLPLDA